MINKQSIVKGGQTDPQFPIRAYAKSELALLYFPPATTPHSAGNHLAAWSKRCQPRVEPLQRQGYRKTAHWFTAREVRLIIYHLGEP